MPKDRWSTHIKTFIPRIQYIASKHHSLRIMIKNGHKTFGLITCEISPRYEAFASTFLFSFERVLRNIWKGIQSLESSFDSHTGDSLVWSFSVTLYQVITICVDVGHKIVVNQELCPLEKPSSWRTFLHEPRQGVITDYRFPLQFKQY